MAQMRKLVGKLNFAQTSVMYGMAKGVGGNTEKRGGWALAWWINLLLVLAPGEIRRRVCAVDVRIYSDSCTSVGSAAAVTLSPGRGTEVTAPLKGRAGKVLTGGLLEASGVFGLEMFATAAEGANLGEKLRGR